jgi:CAP12/Pycsar effector protein, TIR domain
VAPRLFIGSSVENLEVAYAAQENLEHAAEVTVWSQGIFELSKYTMEALLDTLDESDFGLFVLAPNDITRLRGNEHPTVRDNVIFELGLFIGRLGRERNFIIIPRSPEDLHLPTDLLGITPAKYDPNRQDQNLRAALGPACNRVEKAIKKFGPVAESSGPAELPDPSDYDDNDILSILESWLGARDSRLNTQAIRYSDVDRELGLPAGSAKKHLARAGLRWKYTQSRRGKQTIMFIKNPEEH